MARTGIDRRSVVKALAGSAAGLILPHVAPATARAKHAAARAKPTKEITFDRWVAAFRAKAQAHGITEATYTQVMSGMKPDMTGLKEIRDQPEFHEQLWQYLNRRVSDWRIITGRKVAKEYAPLLARIEKDYGVSPATMLGVWGVESTFGDPLVEKNHMKPVIPVARRAVLGRAASPRLLGERTDQCAQHRATRLEFAGHDDRLLGWRHGSYAMDARSLAPSRRRLRS